MYRSYCRLVKVDTSAIDHGLLVSAESKIYLSGKVPRYSGYRVSKLSKSFGLLDIAHLLFVGKIPTNDQSLELSSEFNSIVSKYCNLFTNHQMYGYGLHPSTTMGIILKLNSELVRDSWNPILHYGICSSILYNYRKCYNKGASTPENYDDILSGLFNSVLSKPQLKLLHSLLIVYADHGFTTPTYISRLCTSEHNDLATSIAAAALCYESLNPMIEYHEISKFANENPAFIKGTYETEELPTPLRSCKSSDQDPRSCILMDLWQDSKLKLLVEKLEETIRPRHYLKSDFILFMILQDINLQIGNDSIIDLHLLQTFITLARVIGWIAHCLEQRNIGRRIDHISAYIGNIIDD